MPVDTIVRFAMSVPILLLAMAGRVEALGASCSFSPARAEVLIEAGGGFGIDIGVDNDTTSPVTFTATMTGNDFFGAEHPVWSLAVPGPDIGASVSLGLDTTTLPDGYDEIVVRITSDAGAEVLGECRTHLRVATDTDDDGLLDEWEIAGIDTDDDGIADFFLDPNRKDILVELDYIEGHATSSAAIRAVKEVFANAPVDNPDGSRGINLWVDTGGLFDRAGHEGGVGTCSDGIDNGGDGLIDAQDTVDCVVSVTGTLRYLESSEEDALQNCGDGIDNDGDGLIDGGDDGCYVGDDLGGGNAVTGPIECLEASFYATKAAHFSGDPRMFRYAISGDGADSSCGGGKAEIGGNDFIEYNHTGDTFMHELGHTLGLRHGGGDDINCKPNYVSVMNYDHPIGIRRRGGGVILDFSPPRLALDGSTRGTAPIQTLVENRLSEEIVLDATDSVNVFVFTDPARNKVQWPLDNDIDGDGGDDGINWNGDTDPPLEAGPLTADINATQPDNTPVGCINLIPPVDEQTLTGFDDWSAIRLNFREFADSANGPVNPVPDAEPTLAEKIAHEVSLNVADLSIEKSVSIDPVEVGETAEYQLTITNHGPNPVQWADIRDVVSGVEGASVYPAFCDETTPGTLDCRVGPLAVGATAAFAVGIDTAGTCDGRLPRPITNSASVQNASPFAGPDPVPFNDSDGVTITPRDSTAPDIDSISASPDLLWPPNRKMVPIVIAVEASDGCDTAPTCRVTGVVSDETPSSSRAPDWTIDGALAVSLRAAREGRGDGRTYSIAVSCTDGSGNESHAHTTVRVPHDRGNG